MSFKKLLCLFFLLIVSPVWASRVDTIQVTSSVMQTTIPTAVVVPDSYKKGKHLYPVLYLLHGGGGSFRDWLTKTPEKKLLHKLADLYNIIIVTPDGGPLSYYFDSPVDKASQYETFITKEVLAKIEATYRTVKDRKGRVIAGLSIGGHGAIYLSCRHPELYCAAGSMSGVMNINTATWNVPPDFAKSREQNFVRLLGPKKDSLNPFPGYTAVTLTDQMKANDVHLILDCGVDDFLIGPNRDLHQKLVANKIPHDYTERPGAHTWEYWGNALPYQVLFFQNIFVANGVVVR
ncbi:alpha/beta hydrolase [Xanthocytophaga flava]|uniref:alpha/beta hydrolase n=1 Tax=Xanthocytophaga flava TaxID=3048013 RepID=UPI0028D2F106|nr:alpha/beta hydrolase family protein [Xanthocytophaga flavus]MDJ1472891.1 alpha/beta hydrolase family protein [Xanthocytophaga flavus]